MDEELEWVFFQSYCTGVIEAVFTNRKRAVKKSAELASSIILEDAMRRFRIKEEAEG